MSLIKCPVCGQHHDYLAHKFHEDLDKPLLDKLSEERPGWSAGMGACTRCIDQAHIDTWEHLLKGKGEPGEVNGYKILPTPLRLRANEELTGKGVTICFIDSGFFPHPDLISPQNRILKALDITRPDRSEDFFTWPHDSSWHGTMTSVVAAGNGFLSQGLYRGIASEADLVLLKVMDDGGAVSGEHIAKALDWAVANRKRYNIRVINLSVSDDAPESFRRNPVDLAVERAVAMGIAVVAAAGNDPRAPLRPPANSPHAITVGGLDDRNTLEPFLNTLYNSTYGQTVDSFQKPDLIAPAIWIAAPILPDTKAHKEAGVLFDLYHSSSLALKAKLTNSIHQTRLDRNLLFADAAAIREGIGEYITRAKYISAHYQHADGTSFAAPIVSSIIAQMLQVNPRLTPALIREILLVTARALPGEEAERQGWGVVQPAHAAAMAGAKPMLPLPEINPVIDYQRKAVEFHLQNADASNVALTGDFLNWSSEGLPLEKKHDEAWLGEIPLPPRGTWRYKFIIDREKWISDPRNLFREPDGFNGFNSQLIIP